MIRVQENVLFPSINLSDFYASFRRQQHAITKNADGTFTISTAYRIFTSEDRYNDDKFLLEIREDFVFTLEEINGAGIFQLLYGRLKQRWPSAVDG